MGRPQAGPIEHPRTRPRQVGRSWQDLGPSRREQAARAAVARAGPAARSKLSARQPPADQVGRVARRSEDTQRPSPPRRRSPADARCIADTAIPSVGRHLRFAFLRFPVRRDDRLYGFGRAEVRSCYGGRRYDWVRFVISVPRPRHRRVIDVPQMRLIIRDHGRLPRRDTQECSSERGSSG